VREKSGARRRENSAPRQIIIYRDDSTLHWHVVIHIISRGRREKRSHKSTAEISAGLFISLLHIFRGCLLIESIMPDYACCVRCFFVSIFRDWKFSDIDGARDQLGGIQI
jgi:hypothetical protein